LLGSRAALDQNLKETLLKLSSGPESRSKAAAFCIHPMYHLVGGNSLITCVPPVESLAFVLFFLLLITHNTKETQKAQAWSSMTFPRIREKRLYNAPLDITMKNLD